MISLERWRAPWRSLGAQAPEPLYHALLDCYREPHRRYHTLEHLHECLAIFDAVRALAERPEEVELALWFHDAIYDVRRDDNEARSAAWARASVGGEAGERIHALVMATAHDAALEGADAKLIVDIDLSILGAEPARFAEYEAQIRQEYDFVPEALYRRRRAALLQRFLDRPTIFSTPYFIERYEARARANLATR